MTEKNDPCPCGSGKTYWSCPHLEDTMPESIEDAPLWIQMRVAEGELREEMQQYYKGTWDSDLLSDATQEFFDYRDKVTPAEKTELDHLIGYWAAAPFEPGDLGDSLAQQFLEDRGAELGDLKRRLLVEVDKTPYSFYLCHAIVPEVCMYFRDLLTGKEWEVMEHTGSVQEAVGRVFYTRVVALDGAAITMGCSPYPFDPFHVTNIQRMRKDLKPKGYLKNKDVAMYEDHIRDVYIQLRDMHLNPAPPVMTNTDGDPLEFQTLEWRLEMPLEATIDPLLSLTVDTKAEVLATAKRDGVGPLTWLEIHWVKQGKDGQSVTLLSRMELVPGKIKAEVNSQKRATRLKQEVEKRLGKGAYFERATIESLAAKMKEYQIKGPSEPKAPRDPFEAAAVEKALVEMQRKHWDAWIDESIPALGGLTPKQAAKTKDGRELLGALLFGFEQGNRLATRPSLVVPVEDIKRRLKLI